MTWCVYALKDPRDGSVHYIGKSLNPEGRLLAHMSNRGSRAMKRWIASIGCSPIVEIISKHEIESEALAVERARVEQLQLLGIALVNRKPGGAGGISGRQQKAPTGIGERLYITRDALGLDQTRLSQKSGVAQSTISRLENGRMRMILADVAIALAYAVGVSVEWLVTGEERRADGKAA